MVTRGYEIYKFRGKHYTYYISCDSYPSGAGGEIVSRTHGSTFVELLETIRNGLGKADNLADETVWTISPRELADAIATSTPLSRRSFSIEDGELCATPSVWAPCNNLFIEWTYTINLDLDIFTVNNNKHFHLHSIPHNWNEYVRHGLEGPAFDGRLGSTEDELISLTRPEIPSDPFFTSVYSSLSVQIVKPKGMLHFQPGKRSAVQLARRLFLQWMQTMFEKVKYMIPQWSSDEKAFREIAFMFLCFTAGSPDFVTYGSDRLCTATKDHKIIGIRPADSGVGEIELVADICSHFHFPGKSPWIAPDDEIFWFNGVLVHLTTNMHCEGVIEACIARLFEYGTTSRLSCFHGIVMSLEHVVLVTVFPGGQIERSQRLSIIEFFKYEPLAEHKITIEEMLEASSFATKRTSSKACSEKRVQLAAEDTGGKFKYGSWLPNGSIIDPASFKRAVISTSDTFAAVAHVFEAVELERIGQVGASSRLPNEILFLIIDKADARTRHTLSRVSRALRHHCQQTYLVNDEDDTFLTDDGDECFLTNSGAPDTTYPFISKDGYSNRRNRPTDTSTASKSTKWIPIFGSETGRRALLWDATFVFEDYTSSKKFIG